MSDTPIEVRPARYGERRYVFSNARSIETARYGGRFVHYDTLVQLVDTILNNATLTVACIPGIENDHGDPEIQAFMAEDPRDASVEFIHLRSTYRTMPSPTLAGRVIKALLGDRPNVVLRRAPSREAMAGILSAGVVPVVRPRAV